MANRHGWLRPQFSLRAMLAVVTVFAVYFAYLSQQEVERRRLIADIEDAGGEVKTARQTGFLFFPRNRVTAVQLPHSALTDVRAARLKQFPELQELTVLDFECLTDEALHVYASEMRITRITDELLEGLDGNWQSPTEQ